MGSLTHPTVDNRQSPLRHFSGFANAFVYFILFYIC